MLVLRPSTLVLMPTCHQVGLILPTIMGYLKMQPMRLWLQLYPYRVAMALPFVALVGYAQVSLPSTQ